MFDIERSFFYVLSGAQNCSVAEYKTPITATHELPQFRARLSADSKRGITPPFKGVFGTSHEKECHGSNPHLSLIHVFGSPEESEPTRSPEWNMPLDPEFSRSTKLEESPRSYTISD